MNKNILIAILVIAVLGVGIYSLGRNNTDVVVNEQNPTDTKTDTTGNTPKTPPITVTVPGAPVVSTASNPSVSNSTALATGSVTPNGASTIYWFDYGQTQALGQKSTVRAIGSGYNAVSTPEYITGLKSNTVYYYRLSAMNSLGTVVGTMFSFQTNTTPPVPGKAPTVKSVSATDVARTGANLNGQVNPNGLSTNYWFEYGRDINFGDTTPMSALGNGTTVGNVSLSVSGLDPLTKYYFRLNAQNQYGTANGTILNFTTKGPANPSTPVVSTTSASSVRSTTAQLNGRVNSNGADTTYWFEYSNDSLLGSVLGTNTPTQTVAASTTSTSTVKASLTGLSKNTKYYYRIIGRNQFGTVNGELMSFTTER